MQGGISAIPKSIYIERIQENFDISDFELTEKKRPSSVHWTLVNRMISDVENPEFVEFAMTW